MRRAFSMNFDSMRMHNNVVFCIVKLVHGGRFLKVGTTSGVEEKEEIH